MSVLRCVECDRPCAHGNEDQIALCNRCVRAGHDISDYVGEQKTEEETQ